MNNIPKIQKGPQTKRADGTYKVPISQRTLTNRTMSTGTLGFGQKKPPTGYQFATPNQISLIATQKLRNGSQRNQRERAISQNKQEVSEPIVKNNLNKKQLAKLTEPTMGGSHNMQAALAQAYCQKEDDEKFGSYSQSYQRRAVYTNEQQSTITNQPSQSLLTRKAESRDRDVSMDGGGQRASLTRTTGNHQLINTLGSVNKQLQANRDLKESMDRTINNRLRQLSRTSPRTRIGMGISQSRRAMRSPGDNDHEEKENTQMQVNAASKNKKILAQKPKRNPDTRSKGRNTSRDVYLNNRPTTSLRVNSRQPVQKANGSDYDEAMIIGSPPKIIHKPSSRQSQTRQGIKNMQSPKVSGNSLRTQSTSRRVKPQMAVSDSNPEEMDYEYNVKMNCLQKTPTNQTQEDCFDENQPYADFQTPKHHLIQPFSQESVLKTNFPAMKSIERSQKDKVLEMIIEINSASFQEAQSSLQSKDKKIQTVERKEGFINNCDKDYLQSYAIEHLTDLFEREKCNRYDDLFNHGPEFFLKFGTRKHRMYLIDRLFGVAAQPEMQMTDKSVVYQAVSFFDRYYDHTAKNFHEIKSKPDEINKIQSLKDVNSFESWMKLDVFQLGPQELQCIRQGSYTDLIATGYTGFFLASKNTEVQPISMNDMIRVLLYGENIGTDEILQKEAGLRRAINYENEVATMFEFIMFFIKIWKVACQDITDLPNGNHLEQIYAFLSEVEAAAYDFTKSVLTDTDCMRFKPSVLVCSLISMTIELNILLYFNRYRLQTKPQNPQYLDQLKACSQIWDNLVKTIFGASSLKHIEPFGRYLFLRQQRIYRLFRVQKIDLDLRLQNIYKDRCFKFYNHPLFDQGFIQSHLDQGLPTIAGQIGSNTTFKHPEAIMDPILEFPDLIEQFKETIYHIKVICKDPSSTIHDNPEGLKSMGLDGGSCQLGVCNHTNHFQKFKRQSTYTNLEINLTYPHNLSSSQLLKNKY